MYDKTYEKESTEREKLRLEVAKLKRERVQGWGNGLFKAIIAGCAIGTLYLKLTGKWGA